MKLNRETKHSVKTRDFLKFSDGSMYEVITIIAGTDRTGRASSVSFTIRDTRDGRTIYGYPASELYGAEIITGAEQEA